LAAKHDKIKSGVSHQMFRESRANAESRP